MADFPQAIVPVGHVEPVPRRVRAMLHGRVVLDTIAARYVWEWPYYPQFHIPVDDVEPGLLTHTEQSNALLGRTERTDAALGHTEQSKRGDDEGVQRCGIRASDRVLEDAARLHTAGELAGTVRFDWDALDAWFEEDEEVFVHPRNPYTRVDALRSTRTVRVELDGVLLAESSAPVMVFETGLPTRYYVDRSCVRFEHLLPSDTVTPCPYKGRTSAYWSVRVGDEVHADVAWCYDFPTRQLLPIAGMVAFYNEKVDVTLDGVRLDRPRTHFT